MSKYGQVSQQLGRGPAQSEIHTQLHGAGQRLAPVGGGTCPPEDRSHCQGLHHHPATYKPLLNPKKLDATILYQHCDDDNEDYIASYL